jgi:hypothetical protein
MVISMIIRGTLQELLMPAATVLGRSLFSRKASPSGATAAEREIHNPLAAAGEALSPGASATPVVPLVNEEVAAATPPRACESYYGPDGSWERHGTDNSDFYTVTFRPNFLEMLFLLGPMEGRPARPGTYLDRFDIKRDDAMEEPAVQGELAEIVAQFGFVVFFFVAFPFAPALAWLNNYLEVRIDAIKVMTLMQRPLPRLMTGIGGYTDVFSFMSNMAIVINLGIVFLNPTPLVFGLTEDRMTRVAAWIIATILVFVLKSVVDMVVPDVHPAVELQLQRRDYLVSKHVKGHLTDEEFAARNLAQAHHRHALASGGASPTHAYAVGGDESAAKHEATGTPQKRSKRDDPEMQRFLDMVRTIADKDGAAADKNGRLDLHSLNKHHLQRLGIREPAAEAIIQARDEVSTLRELIARLGDQLSLTDRLALRFCVRLRRINEDTDATTDEEPDIRVLKAADEPPALRVFLAETYTMSGLRELAKVNGISLESRVFIGKAALAHFVADALTSSGKPTAPLASKNPAFFTDKGMRTVAHRA